MVVIIARKGGLNRILTTSLVDKRKCKLSASVRSLTREVYLLPDLLPAGDVGAALVDSEIGLANIPEVSHIKCVFV